MRQNLNLVQDSDTIYTAEIVEAFPSNFNSIVVSPPGEQKYKLPPRTDVEKISVHVPADSFQWGYKGSGAHLTAASLIADAYQSREAARENCGKLVDYYISSRDRNEGWDVTAGEIHRILTDDRIYR